MCPSAVSPGNNCTHANTQTSSLREEQEEHASVTGATETLDKTVSLFVYLSPAVKHSGVLVFALLTN